MLRKGMFLADRYEILEQIGNGGMSDVYKAKCHKLNRYVAIKVLKPEFSQDTSFVSKFRVEAQSAAGLSHPNVVNVYDVGEENGIHYIVMELVEGITLKKYIEKRGKLPYKEAVSIAIQVANGMEAAHKHHIVHRDIKPQNIIISKEGKVKVTDFGIAKVQLIHQQPWALCIICHRNRQEADIRMSAATFIHLVSHCMKCLPEKCRLTVIQPSR